MKPEKVLFICTHNSARSQMAEAMLNSLGKGAYAAESAGFEPGSLNPLAVEVMKEIGIDMSMNKTKSVFDLYRQGGLYDVVITVCDVSAQERCPLFPGIVKRLQWSFEDPAVFTGTLEEKRARMRVLRDTIKNRLEEWLNGN